MSDYISRTELDRIIHLLHTECAYDMPSFDSKNGYKVIPTRYHKGYQQSLIDLESRIAELPSAWIPCSERLPDKAGEYLVTHGSNLDGYRRVGIKMYSPNLHNVDKFDFPNKKRPGWYDYDSEYGHYEWNDVIAWMLLPEPYKADMRGET